MKYTILLFILVLSCKAPTDNHLHEKINQLESDLAEANKLKEDATGFIHTVYFWMKEDVSDAQRADFEKMGLEKLAKVPSIYKLYYGPPAHSPRDVVDNSYDYAWICHFNNKEDQDAYQVDPIHTKFIDDYKDLWDKVIVYDNLLMN